MLGYVQSDPEVPDGLNYKSFIFPPVFENFNVSRAHIGDYMRLKTTSITKLKNLRNI